MNFLIPGWAIFVVCCSHNIFNASCSLSQVEQCIVVCGSHNIFMFPIPGWAVYCCLWFSQYLLVSYPRLSSVLLFVVLTISSCFLSQFEQCIVVCGFRNIFLFPIPGWAVYCCLWFPQYPKVRYPRMSSVLLFVVLIISSCFLSQVEQCIVVCGSHNIFMFPIPVWAGYFCLWFSQYLHVSYPRLSSKLLFVVLTI